VSDKEVSLSTVERAVAIAAEAHRGQTTRLGEPYILHPMRVMLRVRGDGQRQVAALHDVVERTPWTLDQLRAEGFTDEVLDAVAALTRSDGEDYMDFVRRAIAHPLARPVKKADLLDNADEARRQKSTKKTRERLKSLVRAGEHARDCEEHRQRGQFSRALDAARKALEDEPDLPAAHLCTATVYEAQRDRPDSIIRAAQRALAGDSLNTRALETIARQHQVKGDTLEALHYFERLVEADPGNKAIGLGLAGQYQLRRDFDAAVRVLHRLAARFPGDEQVSERLYRTCIEGGQWGCVLELVGARTRRDSALLSDTATLKIAIGAAQALSDTQALLHYSGEAVSRYPGDRSFIGVRGAAFELAGRSDSAVAWYIRAYRADSSAANALRVAKTVIEGAVYDTAGVEGDTTRVPALREALADRLASARPFVEPLVRVPDPVVRLNAVALTLNAGAKLAQAQAYSAAYPWLDAALSALATDTATATAAPRDQLRSTASFWYGVTSVLTSGGAYKGMTDSRSCARAKEFFDRIKRTRTALERGRSVHEPTAAQMLRAVAQYEGAMPSVKQAFQCTNF
jgi:tetratricopeptide (TPR) repeat protein